MRVVIVNYVWDPDLTTPQSLLARFFTLTDWSEAIKRGGAGSVTVCQRFHTEAALERDGIRYQFLRDFGDPTPALWSGGAAAIHRAVTAAEPDLVHVNGVLHPRRMRRLRAVLPPSVALIVQDHGGFDPCAASALKRTWIGRGLSVADAMLMSSRGQVDEWRRSRIAPPAMSMFHVMESGTAMSPLPGDEARQRSGVEGTPAVLWVGRLNVNKDPLTVLSGMSAFFERQPAGRLTMVYAESELEREVRRKIAASPALASRVRLVGRVPRQEMPAYFSAADLFVLGSHREGSGYAAIEALACGAIPVLTDIPSFRALTGDGDVGVLWRPGDPESLSQALSRAETLISADARRACRTLFDERFSWPVLGRRAMEIYAGVLAARRRRALQPVR